MCGALGSGIKNGNAVLFQFGSSDYFAFSEIAVYPQFPWISEIHDGFFAEVQNAEGLYGIVHASTGQVLVPDMYEEISWVYPEEKEWKRDGIVFIALKPDGTNDVIIPKCDY